MNIDRLRYNVPVLIYNIYNEYNLNSNILAMIFKVHPRQVRAWESGSSRPDQDMINALILAYKWIRFWKSFITFSRLVSYSTKKLFRNTFKSIVRTVRKTFKMSDQFRFNI